jgi:hypothetical protein
VTSGRSFSSATILKNAVRKGASDRSKRFAPEDAFWSVRVWNGVERKKVVASLDHFTGGTGFGSKRAIGTDNVLEDALGVPAGGTFLRPKSHLKAPV